MRIFLKPKTTPRDKRPNIYCVRDDCLRPTKYGKEFCSDHIEDMAYAREVIDSFARRGDEVVILAQGDSLPKESQLVKEATGILWEHQTLTAPGLTRHIDLTHEQAASLLRSLESHGYAVVSKSRRGIISATSTIGPDDLPVVE